MTGKASQILKAARARDGVPLSLELRQRDFLNVIDEPMEFNERSLGRCLREVAENLAPDDALMVLGIAHALDNPKSEWKLTLSRRGKGRFVPPDEAAELHQRNMTMLYLLADAEHNGWKTEAAIAELCKRFSVSRATVFSAIADAEAHLSRGAEIFPDKDVFRNPRPARSERN